MQVMTVCVAIAKVEQWFEFVMWVWFEGYKFERYMFGRD